MSKIECASCGGLYPPAFWNCPNCAERLKREFTTTLETEGTMAELERVRVRISVGSREPINRTTSMLPREIKAVLGMVDKHMDGCSMRRGKELAKLESRASVLRAEMNKREPVGGDDA